MFDWLETVRTFVSGIHPLILLIIVFFFGLYVFWRGCAESRKNRSSVFDMFLISGIFSSIVGRVSYVIIEWEQFSSYIWYWIPYEKYGDKIYLFRLLPWRFLSIWDGGLVILCMFVAILLSMTFYTLVIKKWRWKHMFFPIYFSATTMLGVAFVLTGFVGDFNEWIYKGLILIALIAIFYLLFRFITFVVKDTLKEKYSFGYLGLLLVWISSGYIAYIYLSDDFSIIEDICVILFVLWSIIMGLSFLFDLRKARVSIQTRSTVRSVKTN